MKILKWICNKLFKLNLFISSCIPLYILIFIQNMNSLKWKSVIELYKKNTIGWNILIFISVLSIISLIIFFNGNYTKKQKFTEVKCINNQLLNYLIIYIIPLITFDINNNISIAANLIVICVIGIYYIESDLIYINILFIFIRYKVFEDNYGNIIISKRDIDYFALHEEILCKKIGNTKIYIVK